MAAISPVQLTIVETSPSAVVELSYTISATHDDAVAERRYREVVQLFSHHAGAETPIASGTISDGVVGFTTSMVSVVREPEKSIPLADLEQGISPLQRSAISARVTLIPLPPSDVAQESNVVTLGRPVVVAPA
jgi:hypothetical protein